MIPSREGWNIQIIGTDINKKNIEAAQKAIVRPWSFRNVSKEFCEKYFVKTTDNSFQLIPEIREMVHFFYLNLAEDVYPSLENGINSFDLILCNNTLMYFSPAQISSIVKKFVRSLLEDGHLIVSAVEASFIKDDNLQLAEDCHIFKKGQPTFNQEAQKQAEASKGLFLLTRKIPRSQDKSLKRKRKNPLFFDLYEKGDYEACITKFAARADISFEQYPVLIRSYANLGNFF